MKIAPSRQFESIQDWQDSFLALWTHRYDYLWAEHPHPTASPNWQTESRYPLSDRLIQQGSYLYGVRFGQQTDYFLLDIDRGSVYHPSRDPLAWHRICECLERYGWVRAIALTSSYSGGLHLYFPFKHPQKTWEIALAVSTMLENAGFKLAPGQLEVFPNCKPYAANDEHSLYNGHRLPLQAGSYLLNSDLQLIWGDQQTFVQHWRFAQAQNWVDKKAIDRLIKVARRQQFRVTGKANQFLNDLNAEIEQGWTGHGQTNRLLGRIAMRSYIFAHVLYAAVPLEGDALVQDIVAIARSLPGYEDWCRHQHEIEERAKEWVRSIEQSRYFHYGKSKIPKDPDPDIPNNPEPSWNHQQQMSARERIEQAMSDLRKKTTLPKGITERFDALVAYGISGATLYRHRDLWHPRYLENNQSDDRQSGVEQDCLWRASCSTNPTSLLRENGCNTLTGEDSSSLQEQEEAGSGCNAGNTAASPAQHREKSPKEWIALIKRKLSQVQEQRRQEEAQRRNRFWQDDPD
ncbi:hypothetical protein [Leptolyngbya sp. FACHB-17]|uniref:hypothetical protein n=1 Tax=unclassified Leptolyngbya TaxID=2650499 RepID=UPI001680844B|nr:hypothetical protein [Leptolyngbya sp. FACHB-17]MBD2079063.1 hypothetical protein [Leptolyngbya sp. FACHB-17]